MAKPKPIWELPHTIALEILTKKQGMTEERAEEYLAIARGESNGDLVRVGRTANPGRVLARLRRNKKK